MKPLLRAVSSGNFSSSTANLQLSDKWRCSTFILTLAIASKIDWIVGTGQNRRPVSAMKDL
jgi:hypothetical protein